MKHVILNKSIPKYEGIILLTPTITGYINTWVNPYEKEKTLSNPELFGTEGMLILALSVNHLGITFHELLKDEAKG